MTALILFASTFAVVFCLGLQSLNVNGRHYALAAITSFGIGAANLVLLKTAPAPTLWFENAAYLIGGPIAIVCAMRAHPWIVAKLTLLRTKRSSEKK